MDHTLSLPDYVGVVGGVFALLFAIVVWRVGRGNPTSLPLVALLIVEAGLQFIAFAEDGFGIWGRLAGHTWAHVMMAAPFVYARFFATLETPLVRPFQSPRARRILAGIGIALQVVLLPFSVSAIMWKVQVPSVFDAVIPLAFILLLLASVFGLFAAISTVRRASSRESRDRARAYAAAFGTRDGLVALFLFVALVDPFVRIGTPLAIRVDSYVPVLPALATLLFVPLLAYGTLRTRLFDLDLRLKRGISRSTVAAAFIAIYVIASQGAQLVLEPEFGPVVGLVAAGALVFLILPLERAAARFADTMMPKVASTPEYLEERKLAVYRTAIADAHRDGRTPTAGEEALLATLRNELGFTTRDHAILAFALKGTGVDEIGAAEPGAAGSDASRGAAPRAVAMPERYRLIRLLGEGATGRAYLAHDDALSRDVVIKFVPGRVSAEVVAESRRLAAVRHANVVTIHDVIRAGDEVGLVMEYVDGGSLKDRLEKSALARSELARLTKELLSALEVVHGAGLVHRDVKPANVLLTVEGAAKLADFGIAHEASPDDTFMEGEDAHVRGTARYMSPEQAKGFRASPASDLYAAGLVVYESIAGAPFLEARPNESAVEARRRAARPPPLDERLSHVSDDLRAWFARSLHPDPTARFESARGMWEAYEALTVTQA